MNIIILKNKHNKNFFLFKDSDHATQEQIFNHRIQYFLSLSLSNQVHNIPFCLIRICISCSTIFPFSSHFQFLNFSLPVSMRSSKKIPINLEEASVNLLKLKDNNSRISYFLILILIAWFVHKWIFSFSNWFPLALALWASSQVSNLSF